LPHWDSEAKEMVRPPFEPSAEYPFGTDDYGNDLLSLIVYGARVTLVAAAYITLVRIVIGVVVGSIAGWNAGGRADRTIMAFIGGIAAVPLLLSGLILLLALDVRNGVTVFIIALSVIGWTETAQYIRSETMLIRKKPYMEAAVATGLTELQMVIRHGLPNLLPSLLVVIALEMGAVLLLLAELGFLGIFIGGVSRFTTDPVFGGAPEVLVPVPEWGGLVAKGTGSIRANPHLIIFPAMAFVVAILGLNFVGEGLRQLLQRSSINTSYLLSKRMAIFIALSIVGSRIIIQHKGPIPSYGRLASQFDIEQVVEHVEAMAQTGRSADPTAAAEQIQDYVTDVFRQNEVVPGWRTGVFSGYIYEGDNEQAVLGFFPGYDYDHAAELITVFAQMDAPAESPDGAGNMTIAAMLELSRLWAENQFDPRRSLLFIAWNGEPFDAEAALAFLERGKNFTTLPIPIRFPEAYQTAIFHVDLTGGGEELWLAPESDEFLLEMMTESASQANVPLFESNQAPLSSAQPVVSNEFPSLFMQLTEASPDGDGEGSGISGAAEALVITLMKLANRPKSWQPVSPLIVR
jgi:peptide/nickel transport system permease protein